MSIDKSRRTPKVVSASGEIDLSNVSALLADLEEAVSESPRGLLIDLSDATYMDSAGVQAVLNAYVRVNRAGGRIAVVTQHEIVISILQIISADRLPGFFLCENVDAAAKMLADAEPA